MRAGPRPILDRHMPCPRMQEEEQRKAQQITGVESPILSIEQNRNGYPTKKTTNYRSNWLCKLDTDCNLQWNGGPECPVN